MSSDEDARGRLLLIQAKGELDVSLEKLAWVVKAMRWFGLPEAWTMEMSESDER